VRDGRRDEVRVHPRARPGVAAVPTGRRQPLLRRPRPLGGHAAAVAVPGAGPGRLAARRRAVLPHQPGRAPPRLRRGPVVGPDGRPARAVPARGGGGAGRLAGDGLQHAGVDGVRRQPHGARLRRGDQRADLRRRPRPADARAVRCRQPGGVHGQARLQRRVHDRTPGGQRARRGGGAADDAGRGRGVHPAAGGAGDRPARRPRGAGPRRPGGGVPARHAGPAGEPAAAADVPRSGRAGDVRGHHQVRLPAALHGAAARHPRLAAGGGDLGAVGRDARPHPGDGRAGRPVRRAPAGGGERAAGRRGQPRVHAGRERAGAHRGDAAERGDVGDARRHRHHRGAGPLPHRHRDGLVALLLRDPLLGRHRRRGRWSRRRLVRGPRRLRRARRALRGGRRRAARPGRRPAPRAARAPAPGVTSALLARPPM
ncbi:MAG: hypothetical protein AVDCRST_MAG48-828, partial [uncultured Friedmanniella sp.]